MNSRLSTQVAAVSATGRRNSALSMCVSAWLAACGAESPALPGGGGATVEVVSQRIQPSDTGEGVQSEANPADYHEVVQPAAPANQRDIAILFLGGSASTPDSYGDISAFAAGLGYGVINLRYPNTLAVGTVCAGDSPCFGQVRGETIFGSNVEYAPGAPVYEHLANNVDRANSIIGRAVALLDYLAHQEASAANPAPQFWSRFLLADSDSPYIGAHVGNAYPDWSRIVVAGHSQGGGHAGMLAMVLPAGNPVRRAIMFSSPDDNSGLLDGERSADWIVAPSTAPLVRFWGLRHAEDDSLGGHVQQNWANMGGEGVGGPGLDYETVVGDGSQDPQGSHRLVLTEPGSGAHNSTAVDAMYLPAVLAAWRYLFTGAGED